MSHFMTVCPTCNVIWEQCRCPDPAKTITMAICPKCEAAERSCATPTVDSVLAEVQKIKAIGNDDPETSHGKSDELYLAVLEAIRDKKAADPAALASAALEVEKLRLRRWYA
jgi:hypothetical protein